MEELKPGDIVFLKSYRLKGHFYILIEDLTKTKVKDFSNIFNCFSSCDDKLRRNIFSLSKLKYISEGFWEFK